VQVALSGECADEIFGGYPWYRDALTEATTFPWARNTAQREALLHPQLRQQIDAEGYIREQIAQTLRDCNLMPDSLDQEKKHMMQLNIWWFMQTLLERNDRMSSFCGLEVRVPYCDYRIVEYLYGVPGSFMDYKGREKGLLRQAMDGILPEAVAKRKKSPYPKTYDPAYAEAMRQRLLSLMDEKAAPVWQIVDRNALQQLINGESPWPWYGQLMGTPQTMAYMLQVDFWLREYSVCLI
jgi:asparagine synthase (glutamine-hydrolysing)